MNHPPDHDFGCKMWSFRGFLGPHLSPEVMTLGCRPVVRTYPSSQNHQKVQWKSFLSPIESLPFKMSSHYPLKNDCGGKKWNEYTWPNEIIFHQPRFSWNKGSHIPYYSPPCWGIFETKPSGNFGSTPPHLHPPRCLGLQKSNVVWEVQSPKCSKMLMNLLVEIQNKNTHTHKDICLHCWIPPKMGPT